jgi:predicted permease
MYLSGDDYGTAAKTQAFYDKLFDRLSRLPAVETAGGVLNLPMCGIRYTWDFEIEGRPKPEGSMNYTDFQIATPEYFSAMRIPLVSGRLFGAGDGERQPAVVVINQTMARRFWPGGDAIGKRIRLGSDWHEIVGIVGDVHHMGLNASVLCETYLPHLQQQWSQMMIAIRTRTAPSDSIAEVRSEIASLDPNLPVADVRPLESLVSQTMSDYRTILCLLGAFAVAALALAALGLYGTLSYAVARRTREIGIRVALGEPLRRVRRLIVGQGLLLSTIGIAVGCPISLALGRLLETQLYEVKATDPWVLASVSLLLFAVAILSCWIPANRASRIEPITALRAE